MEVLKLMLLDVLLMAFCNYAASIPKESRCMVKYSKDVRSHMQRFLVCKLSAEEGEVYEMQSVWGTDWS